MKLAKMSMVAALLLGANAYAIDNVKVNGDAKLYYGTEDRSTDGATTPDMFDKDASYGDVALNLGLTADLSEGVSAGVSMTAVTTLGLENNLVSKTWSNAHSATTGTGSSFHANTGTLGGVSVDDEMWVGEAWLAGTAGKTTAKVGRQALDTPLVFSETWGIDKNTFEAGVLINQDLPDTTLVGAWIGKSNGSADGTTVDVSSFLGQAAGTTTGNGTLNALSSARVGYVSEGGKFNTFAQDGAYAVGIVNNSFKPLTAQAWYYDLVSVAKAYWLQADIECSLVEGLLIGAQYAEVDADAAGSKATDGYAVMLGYAVKDVVTVKAAYSSVADDGTSGGLGNTATTTGESKLYTEMRWNKGNVGQVGADSYAITAAATAAEIDFTLGYYASEIDEANNNANDYEVEEIALTASKSFGPLDATVAVIMEDYDYNTANTDADTDATSLQVYLTYNF